MLLFLAQRDLEWTLRHGALFDAKRAVPSTDRARINDREHLDVGGGWPVLLVHQWA
jgi:hypothetical protein